VHLGVAGGLGFGFVGGDGGRCGRTRCVFGEGAGTSIGMGVGIDGRRGVGTVSGIVIVRKGLEDGVLPGILVEGFLEFLFGVDVGLKHQLAEIGEGGSSFGFDITLSGRGEEGGESVAEVTGGNEVGVEIFGDLVSGALRFDLFLEFEGVEITEIGLCEVAGHSATAPVAKCKGTEQFASIGGIVRHRELQKRN
jgi:hypothetical protein